VVQRPAPLPSRPECAGWSTPGGPKPTVTVSDADLDHAGAGVPWQHLVSTSPVSTMNPLPTPTTEPAVTLSWTAPVSASALSSFDVRLQSATTTTLFTPWQYPAGWTALTATSVQSQALAPRRHVLLLGARPQSRRTDRSVVTVPVRHGQPIRGAFAGSAGWTRPAAGSLFSASTRSSSTGAGAPVT